MSEKNEQVVSSTDEELSEASLEAVAGGTTQPTSIVGCIAEPTVCPTADPPGCWTPIDPAILLIS
ncbi:MAG TPA: hypothetical protein VF665_03065 [Longimicrobium sp.]|jgi:hypothetical protein|uniref:hypothetical protein n=1 Tax=Longimicrobium sp. TaxID=2029185 RepID=UPI002ED939D8